MDQTITFPAPVEATCPAASPIGDMPPTEADLAWWAAQNVEAHAELPAPRYTVTYIGDWIGRPGWFGPWAVCEGDMVLSAWATPRTALMVAADLDTPREIASDRWAAYAALGSSSKFAT